MATTTTASDTLRKSLQVKPPNAEVEHINFLVYGEPGAGKTWLCGTAADSKETSPVLFIDSEGGVKTIRHKTSIDVVAIRSIQELEDIHNKLYHSIENGRIYYRTVVIDSLTELADLDMRTVMKQAKNKNPDTVDIDVPSPREWGKNRNHLRLLVRGFKDLPCHALFTASLGVEQQENMPSKYHPGFAGKLQKEIPGFCDIVGLLRPVTAGEGVIRQLQVVGSSRVVAKDRYTALGDLIDEPTIPMIWDLVKASNSN